MSAIRLATLCLTCAIAFAISSDPPLWFPRSDSADALYPFIRNGKAGYIDRNGKVVIEPTFPDFDYQDEYFENGRLQTDSGSTSYHLLKGGMLTYSHLSRVAAFHEGLAAAVPKDSNLYGFIDATGRFVIEARFSGPLAKFSGGLARIQDKDLYGYINRNGDFIIPPKFVDAGDFSEARAVVSTSGPCSTWLNGGYELPILMGRGHSGNSPKCSYEYLDESGHIFTNGQYEHARPFREGLAVVKQRGSFGFIDKQGDWAIEPRFNAAGSFSEGLASVQDKNGLWGFIDRNGSWVIEAKYRFAESFHEGVVIVTKDPESSMYLDHSGKPAFPGAYTAASPFHKGLAHVQLKSDSTSTQHYAYIDKTGRIIFKYSTAID